MVRLVEVVAQRVVPETAELSRQRRERLLAIVDEALMERSPAMRRQLAVFLRLIRWLPVLRWGRPFERLAPQRQERVLRWLQDCPVPRLRQGFWGLKSLCFMGYYGQVESWSEIGYRPAADSRERLHA